MTVQSPWKPCDLRGLYPSGASGRSVRSAWKTLRIRTEGIVEGSRVVALG